MRTCSHITTIVDIRHYVISVEVFIVWNHLDFAGTVIRSRRPQISSWRGAVFVGDCTHIPYSFLWIFCTNAEGKIRSTDRYIQKVSTKFWISFHCLLFPYLIHQGCLILILWK